MIKYGRKFQPSCVVNATKQYFAVLLMPGQQIFVFANPRIVSFYIFTWLVGCLLFP